MYIPCLPSLVLLVLAADFFERYFVLLLYLLYVMKGIVTRFLYVLAI